jgi:hypothetical protein
MLESSYFGLECGDYLFRLHEGNIPNRLGLLLRAVSPYLITREDGLLRFGTLKGDPGMIVMLVGVTV